MTLRRLLHSGAFDGAVIVAAASVFFALLALNVVNHAFYTGTAWSMVYFYGVPAGVALAILLSLLLPRTWRQVIALCFVAVVPAVYGAELYLTLRHPQSAGQPDGGAAYDRRTKLEVIRDLRRQGIDAYPAMRAKSMLVPEGTEHMVSALAVDGERVLPLANVPGKRIVSCNETGAWMTFDSDRYGFNNPPGQWSRAPGKIAMVGDSFAQGDCHMRAGETIAARLRARFGGVVNLGTAGFGPLSELASVKEYLPSLRPDTVLWFFYEGNDLTKDLPAERRSETLMAYLNGRFTQDLIGRNQAVSAAFEGYLDDRLSEAMGRVDDPNEALFDFLELYRLRQVFGLDAVSLGIFATDLEQDLAVFRAALAEARRTVESWGGMLSFVYLPSSARYFAAPVNGRIRDFIRTRVLDIVRDMGIALIDVEAAFAASPDPRRLFVYAGSHYNGEGYAVTARAVARRLLSDRRAGSAKPRAAAE
ncbi:MAG: hypothetical protein IIC54_11780 [Proteobacteria bacterium]|nr:hypothetical protein [Pseudomonadota bacterium]MCH8214733.1 hypothetical protein [Pseudomonadota bacterium]